MMRAFLLLLALLPMLLAGCSSTPVRHLASDASLIKPGETTRKDVLLYLGEPNGRRTVGPGVEEFVYYQDIHSSFSGMPVIGSWVGKDGYEMIIITLKGDLVTDCQFRTFSEADQDWIDDFTWQEVK